MSCPKKLWLFFQAAFCPTWRPYAFHADICPNNYNIYWTSGKHWLPLQFEWRHKPSSLLCNNCINDCDNDSSPHNNKSYYKSVTQAWQMLFESHQNRCQQCNNEKWKSCASCPILLSNFDYKNSHAKSLAASRPRRLSNFDSNKCQLLTSVDCWVIFYRSQTSCSSHHSQPLFQVDWWIGFWGCTFCSIYFRKRFHLHKWIESWGSMGSSSLFSSVQVDCYIFQNLLSLLWRLQNILWERMAGKGRWLCLCQTTICKHSRMGATVATQWTHWPCWPWPYRSSWPCKTNWPCQPHWSHWLHWPPQSHQPCGPHWLQQPYQPHWPHWHPQWPHWMQWLSLLHWPCQPHRDC